MEGATILTSVRVAYKDASCGEGRTFRPGSVGKWEDGELGTAGVGRARVRVVRAGALAGGGEGAKGGCCRCAWAGVAAACVPVWVAPAHRLCARTTRLNPTPPPLLNLPSQHHVPRSVRQRAGPAVGAALPVGAPLHAPRNRRQQRVVRGRVPGGGGGRRAAAARRQRAEAADGGRAAQGEGACAQMRGCDPAQAACPAAAWGCSRRAAGGCCALVLRALGPGQERARPRRLCS